MGYYSRLTGEILIVPPIPAHLLSTSKYMPTSDGYANEYEVVYRVTEEPVESPNTGVYQRMVSAIEPGWEDSFSMYKIDEHLAEIATELLQVVPPGSRLDGYLQRSGEEQGDIERYWWTNNGFASEKAVLAWPDGTLVTGHEL